MCARRQRIGAPDTPERLRDTIPSRSPFQWRFRGAVHRSHSNPLRPIPRSVTHRPHYQFHLTPLAIDRERIIRVACISAKDSEYCPIPILDSYFTDGAPESLVLRKNMNGQPLRFPLVIWFSPTALTLHTPPNHAISRLIGHTARRTWCGPVVAFKFSGTRMRDYTDAGAPEIPTLANYFMEYV